MKKLLIALSVLSMLFISCGGKSQKINYIFNKDGAIVDEGSKTFNSDSAMQTVKDMKIGWCLGNTLDATARTDTSSETSWGQPITNPYMIDGLAETKIKTIRIPVSWTNHIIDNNYTIDPNWMDRVKMIVDWAIDDDMYVILNVHHDTASGPEALKGKGYYYPNNLNYDKSVEFLENVWGQICLAFNNGYDEHLIFETLNEPRLRGTDYEWWFDEKSQQCLEAADCLNKYNQIIVDTIRSSGGNNAKRFIMVPGLQASPTTALSEEFKLPKDSVKDGLIVAVHMYSPYVFAMQSPGTKTFTPKLQSELASTFKALNEKFVVKGTPVVIGEFGAVNKDNPEDRIAWAHAFIKYSRKYGMTSCLWDNGAFEPNGTDYNEKFGYYDRDECAWYCPDLIEAMVEEAYAEPAE